MHNMIPPGVLTFFMGTLAKLGIDKINRVEKDSKDRDDKIEAENLRQWDKIDKINDTLSRVDENVKNIKTSVDKMNGGSK